MVLKTDGERVEYGSIQHQKKVFFCNKLDIITIEEPLAQRFYIEPYTLKKDCSSSGIVKWFFRLMENVVFSI